MLLKFVQYLFKAFCYKNIRVHVRTRARIDDGIG